MTPPQTISIAEFSEAQRREMDQRLMARALELAKKGEGQVSPGPLVGCVIASPDGRILGEGFYCFDQIKHAETYALEEAGTNARGATAYVSLEPHAHQGRTPPCTDALINAGIKRVVSPIEDPNPKVSGKGFAHLKSAGVEVSVGLLAREGARANERYIHFMCTGRPFVHLKFAASLDGKIATRTGESRWITSEEARKRAHALRHENDAILIGAGTAAADDPLLTDRSGLTRRKALVRVVLDERLRLAPDSKLAQSAAQTPVLVFAGDSITDSQRDGLTSSGVDIVQVPENGRDLMTILRELGSREIQSVLVEGGAGVSGKLLDADLVDKISYFIAPIIIGGREAVGAIGGEGATSLADAYELQDLEITHVGRDLEVTGYPKRRRDQ